jgi:hypothetical protein
MGPTPKEASEFLARCPQNPEQVERPEDFVGFMLRNAVVAMLDSHYPDCTFPRKELELKDCYGYGCGPAVIEPQRGIFIGGCT